MGKSNIVVEARLFAAALRCVAKPGLGRSYLEGVFVEPHPDGGAVLVSTDGHRMLVIHDVNGKCGKPAIVAAAKPIRTALTGVKPASALTVDTDGGVEVVDASYRAANGTLTDAVYPDWRAIPRQLAALPKRQQSGAATFNSQYLADFGGIAKLLADDGTNAVRVIGFGDGNPALINFVKAPHAFGILMPMRQGEDLNGFPAFMRALTAPTKRKAA